MTAAARVPAPRPEAPTPAPSPAPPEPARGKRGSPAGGPPALRLAEPSPVSTEVLPAAKPAGPAAEVPAPASRAPQPQRPAEPQREEGFTDRILWGLVREFAPDLEPIIRRGIFGWLEEQITAAIGRLVDTLFAPVRAVTNVAGTLTSLFQSLVAWMQEAAAKIAKGDCSSITEAAQKIEEVVSGVLSVVTDKVKALAKKVGDFFTGLWERFGAPVWDMLKQIGGAAWERIQALGRLIWDKTEPIRRRVADAWKWIKDRLGIGEGPEGQNGLLQWVKAKAEEVWNWLKPKIEPYKKQLMIIAGIALALSPAGPLLFLGAGVVGLLYGIRWIRDFLRSREAIIAQRGLLQGVVIPTLMRGVETVTGALKAAAARVSTKLGDVVGALGQLAAGLASSLLSFVTRLIEWIGEQFAALSKWAEEKLSALVEWVTTGLARLKAFLQPVLDVLRKVAEIYLDILKLPLLAATAVWHKIPACLRDPFVDFLINQVLKRIPLFKQVTEVLPAMWQKIKTTALSLLRKVFREGKLKEAALDVLVLLLDALEVPLELVKTVLAKGAASLNLILDKPIEFLTNMLGAVRQGVFQFGERIVDHLLSGLKNWLFGAAVKAGLTPPKELSFTAVFEFILQVLDVTVDRVLERLEKRIGPEKTAVIRKTLTIMSKVWEWLSTLLSEGPGGVWKKLKERLGDLWQGVLNAAVGYVTSVVTKVAIPRLLAMVAGGPIGVVINAIIAIWKALQTFAKYFKKILEIMNAVFDTIADIARGALAGAANLIEDVMDRSLPIVIGFLANQIGLGDLSERIKEVLETIRAKVAEAIDWLIDKALAIGGAVLGLIKAGVAKVLEWWKATKEFTLGGKKHTLKFQGEGPDAQLMAETTPMVLEKFLATLPKPANDKQRKALDVILAEKKKIDDLKNEIGRKEKSYGQEAGKTIMASLEEIARQLPVLGGEVPPTALKTKKAYKALKDDVGQEILAFPLSLNPGGLAGSQPHETTDLWDEVSRRPSTYVQGHLLNHHVHGPGKNFNMAPIPIAANNEMEQKFEHYVKHAVLSERKVVEYRVVMDFTPPSPKRTAIPAENKLPTRILFEAYELEPKGTDWKRGPSLFPSGPLDIPTRLDKIPDVAAGVRRERVNLSEDTPKELEKNPGITPDMAQAIRRLRLKRETPFHVYADLADAGLTGTQIQALEEDTYVTLR